MAWTLVVSDNDAFQAEARSRLRDRLQLVGATGEQAACGLIGSIDVERVLVDAMDDVGRRFLAILRNLPGAAIRDVDVVVIAPSGEVPRFSSSPTLDEALRS